ncbi:hypothetical protein [Streptomyces sp. MJM1172]|uniref:hypothetical protein n=1 Tax=Streptomyces sp. MJM1172 TaxID=1703926 RepID=UPI000D19842D|nr:hypothetical protein [Streptomyces sp. MJM1172]
MRQFFAGVDRDMTSPSVAVLDDAVTVLAALLHAARPPATRELADALGWPQARAATALQAAEHQPEVCGPLTLQRTPSGAHLATGLHGRLTPAQRTALARSEPAVQDSARASLPPLTIPADQPTP